MALPVPSASASKVTSGAGAPQRGPLVAGAMPEALLGDAATFFQALET